jgi:hypothetical protein
MSDTVICMFKMAKGAGHHRWVADSLSYGLRVRRT